MKFLIILSISSIKLVKLSILIVLTFWLGFGSALALPRPGLPWLGFGSGVLFVGLWLCFVFLCLALVCLGLALLGFIL